MRPTTTPAAQDEFRYGWRYVWNGREFDQVPLTLEDCLHPQEGDVISENTDHDRDLNYLCDAFRSRPLAPPLAFVSRDMGVEWGVPGIRHHSPDVGVWVGLDRDPRPTGLMELKAFNGRCAFLVEVVSPNTRKNDVVDKFDHYFRVGVPFYVIIDQEKEGGPRTLRAYRRTPSQYVEVATDSRGWVELPAVGFRLGLRDGRSVCFDAVTDEEFPDVAGLCRQRDELRQFKEESEQAFSEQYKELKTTRQEADRAIKAADAANRKLDDAEQLIRDLHEKLRALQPGPPPA